MRRLRRWWRLHGPRRDDYAIGYGAKLPKNTDLVGKQAYIPIKLDGIRQYSQVEAPTSHLARMDAIIKDVWREAAKDMQRDINRQFLFGYGVDEPYRPGWNAAIHWLENRKSQAQVEAETKARRERELAAEWPFPKWGPVADRPAGYDPEDDWMDDDDY